MSRIGKQPVVIPDKVDVKIDGQHVQVKGPKGQLEFTFAKGVNIAKEEKQITVNPIDEERKNRALWGMTRTIIYNMVVGVTDGFTKTLEFNGVGYKAQAKGKELVLNLGYSHPINYQLPEGVEAKVQQNKIMISGCSKELVGFTAAKVRSFRPPEPYKGKGIKYADEVIIRKAGKTGSK